MRLDSTLFPKVAARNVLNFLRSGRSWRFAVAPALAIFVSANVANAGNLLFNVLFSRWMGPEIFADLATILTLKLAVLAVLNAVQLAVSQKVASSEEHSFTALQGSLRWISVTSFIALGALLGLILPFSFTGALNRAFGLHEGAALALVLLALPFSVPLSLGRGIAMGRIDTVRIICSANLEMLVRLVGAIFAWHAGFGLNGVAVVIALSIFAGWLPVRLPRGPVAPRIEAYATAKQFVRLALPFATLQAAQVVLLDGDILIARSLFEAEDAGLIAALALFQRIQFYACFALATLALPAVANAQVNGMSLLSTLRPTLALVAMVNLPLITASFLFPNLLIITLAGPAFSNAADELWLAALAGFLFTLSYLGATVLAALNDRRGIWTIAAAVPMQIGGFMILSVHTDLCISSLLTLKVGVQAMLTGAMIILFIRQIIAR